MLTVVALGLRLGLLGGTAVGAGDNADGLRVFCARGLVPGTPDGLAAWRGVVVVVFRTGNTPCPVRSSASAILAATVGDGPTFSLVTLALVYVALTALGVGIAAGALARVGGWRALLAALPVLPLVVVPWWSRFFVSTYDEPAGLLGTVWVMLGLVVAAASRPRHHGPRLAALALLVVGGVTAATAKPGFVPVGAVAALVCALLVLRDRWWRVAGPIAALLTVALAAGPVANAVALQNEDYPQINTHNLINTAVLPELGSGVLAEVGLPPDAAPTIGQGYYWAAARNIPGWPRAIGDRPFDARRDAYRVIAEHPTLLPTMVARGLTATMRPALSYLPSAPRGSVPERDELRVVYPEAGALTGLQLDYLDDVALGWLPAAVIALALLAGLVTVAPRARRRPTGTAARLARTAAATSVLALGVVVLAVLGDGYYELTKHVWLASYLLLMTGVLGACAAATALTARRVRAPEIVEQEPR